MVTWKSQAFRNQSPYEWKPKSQFLTFRTKKSLRSFFANQQQIPSVLLWKTRGFSSWLEGFLGKTESKNGLELWQVSPIWHDVVKSCSIWRCLEVAALQPPPCYYRFQWTELLMGGFMAVGNGWGSSCNLWIMNHSDEWGRIINRWWWWWWWMMNDDDASRPSPKVPWAMTGGEVSVAPGHELCTPSHHNGIVTDGRVCWGAMDIWSCCLTIVQLSQKPIATTKHATSCDIWILQKVNSY